MSIELFSAEDRDILSKSMGREPDDALLSRLLLTARQLASERYAEDMHVFRQKLAKYRSVLADYEAELAAWQKQAQVFDQRSRRYDGELAQWLSLPNRGDTPRPIPPVDPGPAPELPEPPAEPQEPNDRHSVDLLMAEQRAALARAAQEPKADIAPDYGVDRAEIVNEAFDLVMSRLGKSTEAAIPPPDIKQGLGYPDEAPDLAAENEALREENDRLRKELETRDAPVGLPPNPSETKLADYYIPAEIRDLMEEGETFPQARKRLSELLNVEKAELRLKRAAGSATEAELKREADVDRLQGLFSKLGEI